MKLKKNPSQDRSKETVERLTAAASKVLMRDGVQAMTIRAVAAEAGLGVGSIYDYFPNKQTLLEAVCEQRLAKRLELFDQILLKQDNSLSLAENLDVYRKAEQQGDMSSPLGPQLRSASEKNPGLRVIVEKYEKLLTQRMADMLARYAPTLPSSERRMLANFLMHIDYMTMRLLHHSTPEEREFYRKLQNETHTYLLAQVTGKL